MDGGATCRRWSLGQDHVAYAAISVLGEQEDGGGGSGRDGEILTFDVLDGRSVEEGTKDRMMGWKKGGIGWGVGVYATEDGAGLPRSKRSKPKTWEVGGYRAVE